MTEKLSFTGVFCYEAMPNGDLKLYVVPPDDDAADDSITVVIQHEDLSRLLAATGDAMMNRKSRH